jgi:hypothetical protein
MKIVTVLLTFAVASDAVGGALVYKCKTDNGPVFQDVPCANEEATESTKFYYAPRTCGSSCGVSNGNNWSDSPQFRPAENERAGANNGVGDQEAVASAPRDSKDTGYRCTRPNGSTYYSRNGCGSTLVRDPKPDWKDGPSIVLDSRGVPIPGAVRTGPNSALDPASGQVFPVFDTTPRPSHREADQEQAIDRESACEQARQEGINERKANLSLSYKERQQLDDAVYDLCH